EIHGKEGSSNGVDDEAKDANKAMDSNVVNGIGIEVDSQNRDDGCILNDVTPMIPKSYAKVTTKFEVLIDNKLKTVPIGMDENGDEYVIFNDELINEGSSKWNLTMCGYFVGHKMHINVLRGINDMIEKGLWMVINKPLVVQKWDINMSIDKNEPNKLPLWVRLCNLPIEARSINGINALASRISKPLIMDAMTASMCKHGTGRIGYARVLVEVQAKKGLPENIDVCEVFGRSQDKCKKDAKE
ncbi:zinc knuckle CX2CX4HX4C containing protein, partial [Tanacetum coccineum]